MSSSLKCAKEAGKWAITLTAPLWVLPVATVAALVLLFSGIHDSIWGNNKRTNKR